RQRPTVIFDAARVVVCGYSVLGNVDWHAGFLGGIADDAFDALRIKLVTHLRQFGARWWRQILFAHEGAGVGLHAKVVAGSRGFKPRAVDIGYLFGNVIVSGSGLVVRHGEIEPDRHGGTRRLHRSLAFAVRGEEAVADFLAVAEEEAGEFRRVERGARSCKGLRE